MNRILYERRCRCNEEKKLSLTKRSEGKALPYPDPEFDEITSKTFQIRYDKKLSTIAKFILNSFEKKYIYYAIDDIMYLLKSNPIERDSLLKLIYSPVLSLQNNFSVNFFDIWIQEIYINEISKINKFIINDSTNLEQFSEITIKFFYTTRLPVKKKDSLW